MVKLPLSQTLIDIEIFPNTIDYAHSKVLRALRILDTYKLALNSDRAKVDRRNEHPGQSSGVLQPKNLLCKYSKNRSSGWNVKNFWREKKPRVAFTPTQYKRSFDRMKSVRITVKVLSIKKNFSLVYHLNLIIFYFDRKPPSHTLFKENA